MRSFLVECGLFGLVFGEVISLGVVRWFFAGEVEFEGGDSRRLFVGYKRYS